MTNNNTCQQTLGHETLLQVPHLPGKPLARHQLATRIFTTTQVTNLETLHQFLLLLSRPTVMSHDTPSLPQAKHWTTSWQLKFFQHITQQTFGHEILLQFLHLSGRPRGDGPGQALAPPRQAFHHQLAGETGRAQHQHIATNTLHCEWRKKNESRLFITSRRFVV